MIEGKFLKGTEDLSEAFNIRKKVFCEEQGISMEEEFDTLDRESIHVIIYDENNIVATGRLYRKDDYYKIGRIAVLKEFRGKYYGDFVVRMLIDRAFQEGATCVHVGAQRKAQAFYETIGFVVDGEEYDEMGILHIPMSIKNGALCKGCQNK